MNWDEDLAGKNPEVKQALKHFKASMDAWSDAARSTPRTVARANVRRNWQPAASWAIGCLLAAGSMTIAVHEFVHRQQPANQAAQRATQKTVEQRAVPERTVAQTQSHAPAAAAVRQEAGTTDEDLLASVDKDISQQVPDAMEPLAQLMDDNGAQ